ncbi:MAG TPA: hypothetical protein VFM51_02270 [Solirubrobacterales bacterium]|nr:hypothetical protein [Solirubrobacterales bacterium]
MERRLGVGTTLSEAFSIYRKQAGVLLPVAFWLFLALGVIEALAADSLELSLLALVVGIALSTLYQGMVVGLVSDVQDGRRDSSIGELVRSVTPVLAPLIGAGILAGLGIVGGFVLFVVPGLYLLTIWAVVAPVIVVERRPIFDAFGRSRQLVRDNGWPVLGAVLTAYLITFAAAVVFIAIAVSLAEGILVEIVFSALASTLTAPIPALVAAVLYFRLRAIKDERPADANPQETAA